MAGEVRKQIRMDRLNLPQVISQEFSQQLPNPPEGEKMNHG